VLPKDALILIMHEASALKVESVIQEQLFSLMSRSSKTVIAIAHRRSTIAALDRSIALDQDRIVEDGNHVELVRRGGLYSELWNRSQVAFCQSKQRISPRQEGQAQASAHPEQVANMLGIVDTIGAPPWSQGEPNVSCPFTSFC
jgi:hypothetical protein